MPSGGRAVRKLTSREIFLLVVVAGLGTLGWVYGRGGNLGIGTAGATELDPLSFGDAPKVELARLDLEPEEFNPKARNLFSYFVPPPPVVKTPPPRQRQEPVRVVTPTPTVGRTPPRPQRPREIPAPKPTCRYIGHMGQKDRMMAVLECGDEVVLAAKGEVFEKQFKVLDFKYEMLEVGYTAEKWAEKSTELAMKR